MVPASLRVKFYACSLKEALFHGLLSTQIYEFILDRKTAYGTVLFFQPMRRCSHNKMDPWEIWHTGSDWVKYFGPKYSGSVDIILAPDVQSDWTDL